METCQNCGQTIGNLETPHLFGEHVVCPVCYRRLSESAKPTRPLPSIRQRPDGSYTEPTSPSPAPYHDPAAETRALHNTLKFWARVILYGALAFYALKILLASRG